MCIVYTRAGYTVSFPVAVRYIVGKVTFVVFFQEGIHECYRSSAVYIIVAINHYALMPLYSCCDALRGLFHPLHQEGVVQVVQLRPEKKAGAFIIPYAAQCQYTA